MQFKWPAPFSVLNGPRFSQALNVPLRGDKLHHHNTLWGLPGHRLMTCRPDVFPNWTYTAPLSTSAHILQTGLNKIWRKIQPSKNKPSTQAYPYYSSGSRASSFYLQQPATDKQSEQDVVHHSQPLEVFRPQLAEPKPDLPTPTCPHHLSASPALSSSFLDAPTEGPGQPEEPIAYHLNVAPDQVSPRGDATYIFDMEDLDPVPTSRSARIAETDFDRILNNLSSQSSELTLTTLPSGPPTPLFAIRHIATPRQKQVIIYQPKPIRGFNPVPQLALAALNLTPSPSVDNLHPFSSGQHTVSQPLTEYALSTQPNSGISPLSLASPSRVAQNQYSYQQSTPFVPAPKRAKRKFSFKPFSPEEHTISLPPSQSNHLGITGPIWGLDHDFSVNTGSSLLLSPIFLDLLQPLECRPPVQAEILAPPSNQLEITIAVPEGNFNADDCMDRVARFLFARAGQVENSLVVVWQESYVDSAGTAGFNSLKTLFVHLDKAMLDSGQTALYSFSRLSITIPDSVKPVTCNLGQHDEDDSIDLGNATNLVEFFWYGDLSFFASKFRRLPSMNLTVLNVTSIQISIEDAVALLHACPILEEASLGIIQDNDDCDGHIFKPSVVYRTTLPNLNRLTLDSAVILDSLVPRIDWTSIDSVTFTLRKTAASHIHSLPLPWERFQDVTLNCHLEPRDLSELKAVLPYHVQYNDIGL
ncbi:hypothetical protein BYT27DRAFT_7343078 [Phlegmacium glaucopus]|nr:hypothetical protein BYT27DRAFT_7343078 [Phlegmacium glaucopus]